MPRYGVNPLREFNVNQTYPVRHQFFDQSPETTRLANGDFIVVWYAAGDSTFTFPPQPSGVAIQRYNAYGTPDGAPLLLAQVGYGPAVAGLADGGYVVAWQDLDSGNGPVEYLRFDANGTQVGSIVAVSGAPPGFDERYVEVTASVSKRLPAKRMAR